MTAKGRTVGPKQMTLLNMFGRQGSGKAASETNGDSAEIVNNAEQNEHPSDEVTESCTPNVQEPLPPPESASQAKDVRDDDVNENSSGLSKWPLRVQGNGVRKNKIFSIFEKPQKSADSPASVPVNLLEDAELLALKHAVHYEQPKLILLRVNLVAPHRWKLCLLQFHPPP
ncbi:hypothetical protein BD410DRAFT_25002 [Rickenella mellea]|uniref:Uncharacterized protein n=1 Tax=Rickenella mellea TaxID=50990 RepID=A0A4V3AZK7_9AGAM|nr:hypothetical protein BD410DRAFT_25002 [Rickenella mellea]